jgi:flavodoxin
VNQSKALTANKFRILKQAKINRIMKTLVISYSLTGNNNAIATGIATVLAAKHIKITEPRRRTTANIFFDILFSRTPEVSRITENADDYDFIIFVAPVWMGHVATPLRAYFRYLAGWSGKYAFVSVSGGADGGNPKLAGELLKRMGKAPIALIDLHIADLITPDNKPTRAETSAYHLKDADVMFLTERAVVTLWQVIAKY